MYLCMEILTAVMKEYPNSYTGMQKTWSVPLITFTSFISLQNSQRSLYKKNQTPANHSEHGTSDI